RDLRDLRADHGSTTAHHDGNGEQRDEGEDHQRDGQPRTPGGACGGGGDAVTSGGARRESREHTQSLPVLARAYVAHGGPRGAPPRRVSAGLARARPAPAAGAGGRGGRGAPAPAGPRVVGTRLAPLYPWTPSREAACATRDTTYSSRCSSSRSRSQRRCCSATMSSTSSARGRGWS